LALGSLEMIPPIASRLARAASQRELIEPSGHLMALYPALLQQNERLVKFLPGDGRHLASLVPFSHLPDQYPEPTETLGGKMESAL